MSTNSDSTESLSHVFCAIGISDEEKQHFKHEFGINSIETLLKSRNNLANNKRNSSPLLVAAADFINECLSQQFPSRDCSHVHEFFKSKVPFDQSWEHHLACIAERTMNQVEEKLRTESHQCNDQTMNQDEGKTRQDQVVDIEEMQEEECDDNRESITDNWIFDEENQCLVLKQSKLHIPKKLFDALFEHQKEGISWLSGLHANKPGGIIGDGMGMGKTRQALTFLFALMSSGDITNALVVCPKTTLNVTWLHEATHLRGFFSWKKEEVKIVTIDCGIENQEKVLKDARHW